MVTGVAEDEQVLKGETDDHLSRFYGFAALKLKVVIDRSGTEANFEAK